MRTPRGKMVYSQKLNQMPLKLLYFLNVGVRFPTTLEIDKF